MAQGEASIATASCGGEDGGTVPVTEAYSAAAGDEYTTASTSFASSSQWSEYVTASMSDAQISAAIEKSREQGWTELKDWTQEDAVGSSSHALDNQVVWEELKKWNPSVFRDLIEDGYGLKLGRLIGEGGQAQILEASLKIGGVDHKNTFVAKVFRMEGFSLGDLKHQFPLKTKEDPEAAENGQFGLGKVVFDGSGLLFCCKVRWGTLLNDGRFALVMKRYWGDLRTLINLRLSDNCEGPPFSHPEALEIMWDISRGMKHLHGNGVLHKDLKAANILIATSNNSDPTCDEGYQCEVADFESSMFVQGTGFWRAPEVLKELLKNPQDRSEYIWTEKVDAYSFAMTCYEVLTGHIPFYGHVKSDWKRVIDGERPHLPDYIDPGVRELLERCWHDEPSERPTFEVIFAKLKIMFLLLV